MCGRPGRDADAVVCAISPRPGTTGQAPSLAAAARALITGLAQVGVNRLVAVGGAGSLEVAPGLLLMDADGFPAEYKDEAIDARDALDVYRVEAGALDWTFVSPAAMIGPGERTGTYRTTIDRFLTDADGRSTISFEDYAVAIVDELEHPLLQSTKEAWRVRDSPTYRWDVRLPEHFSIDVGKASHTRALRLLQALFTALERRGHGIARSEKGAILVKVLDETCEIALRERLRQTRTPPSKDPYRRPYELTPSGEFELRIERPFRRVTLRDRAQLPLERQLNSVVVQLIRSGAGAQSAPG